MRLLRTLTFTLGMFVATLGARADLISVDDSTYGAGAFTLDTETGLQWLDLTLSGTRSNSQSGQ